MLGKILIKDLKKRKGVNFILFLFIVIATTFLASSVNDILTVSYGLNYYLDYAKVPDISLIGKNGDEKDSIKEWLAFNKEVKDFSVDYFINIQEKCILIPGRDEDEQEYNANGQSVFIGSNQLEYAKVFDENGEEIILKDGEIALCKTDMVRNHLAVGDGLQIKIGEKIKNYTITKVMKDAAYGSGTAGMTRLSVNENELDALKKNKNTEITLVYNVATDHILNVEKDLNKQAFTSIFTTVERSLFEMAYSFDMILAGLLSAVGVSLILISLLVLRFTITFTLEEDYRELGIMKATGFQNFTIKSIYLIKYLVIVLAGSLLGLIISFPVGNAMIQSVSEKMIMASENTYLTANIISAVSSVVIVMLFCYGSTRRLNKLSAVQAIRGGQSGKRYQKRRGITLHRRAGMSVPFFLAGNDVLATVKRYIILMVTFCMGFVLVAFPLNTVNTMRSSEMAGKFAIDPNKSVYVTEIEQPGESGYQTKGEVEKGLNRLALEMKEKGYDVSLTSGVLYSYSFYSEKADEKAKIMCIQPVGANPDYLIYDEGIAPTLDNEVGASSMILKEQGWKIGDTIHAKINGAIKNLVITGTYQDYMQLGKSIRLSPSVNCKDDPILDYWKVMVDMKTDLSQQELADKFSKEFPDHKWQTAQDVVDSNVGGIQDSVDSVKYSMTALICMVLMLITVLMVQLFVVREKGEIAMMKSVGFKNRSIRRWQILRMCIVLFVSLILSVPLSLLCNQFLLKPIFATMGANVNIQVVAWQVYGLYPLILLAGIILATVYATRGIGKIDIRELNNLE